MYHKNKDYFRKMKLGKLEEMEKQHKWECIHTWDMCVCVYI